MRKKICFFSGDITRSGGTERVSVQLANALQKEHSYDICFMSLTEKNDQKMGNYKYFLLSNLRKPDKFKDVAGNDYAFLHLKHI